MRVLLQLCLQFSAYWMKTFVWILNAILMHFILIGKPLAQDNVQEKAYQYHVGINGLRGFLQPHNEEVRHLTYGRPTGFELHFNKKTLGSEAWQNRFNRPDIGFSLTYFNTDMEPTGHLIAGLAYMEFYLIRTRFGSFTFRAASGLTYATKTYDRETNNLNTVISSRLTYSMQGRFGFHIPVTDRWTFYPSATFSHASNGSLKLPNAGINIVSANVGLTYSFSEVSLPEKPGEEEPLEKRFHVNMLISGAAKELYPTGGPKYGYWTIRTYFDKPLSRVSRLVGGIDYIMNGAKKEQIRRKKELSDKIDYKRIGLIIGHELTVSKVSVMTQFGYYVYRPFRGDDDPDYYQRYGLKYYITEELFATAMLKTFIGRADTFDFGIGIRL